MKIALFALVAAVATTIFQTVDAAPKWHELTPDYDYESWAAEFKKGSENLSSLANLERRRNIFAENLANIIAHNKGPSSYKMGVNQFSDMTAEEFVSQLGFDKTDSAKRISLSAQEDEFDLVDNKNHPKDVDWDKRGYVPPPVSQGHCGSCWAHSSTTVLDSIASITTGRPVNVSRQAVVDCFDNVNSCGGTGGCFGATAALAFSYIKENGVPLESEYPYVSGETRERGECRAKDFPTAVTLDGWKHLSANHLNELMQMVSTYGPVAVSVDASSFHQYESGILDTCSRPENKVIINHAVSLVGYGFDETLKLGYFTVRNSWGATFGESGNIRIFRATGGNAEACYVDDHPESGSACKDDPLDPYPVCGCVGILSNAVVPTGIKVLRNH